jgi:hypothetical protein
MRIRKSQRRREESKSANAGKDIRERFPANGRMPSDRWPVSVLGDVENSLCSPIPVLSECRLGCLVAKRIREKASLSLAARIHTPLEYGFLPNWREKTGDQGSPVTC